MADRPLEGRSQMVVARVLGHEHQSLAFPVHRRVDQATGPGRSLHPGVVPGFYLGERDCLEAIAVKGKASEIRHLSDELTTKRGVKILKEMIVSV